MVFKAKTYKNSTELANVSGVPIYMDDIIDAALRGRLNVFLQGDTGSGKTQLIRDAIGYFGDKYMFLLGRNDMDTRELFQRLNLGRLYSKPSYNLEPLVNPDTGDVEWIYHQFIDGEVKPMRLDKEKADRVRETLEKMVGTTEDVKEVTSKVKNHMVAIDELPNCVPAVRAQLFNLFDGFIEIDGRAYPLGGNLTASYPDGRIITLPEGTDNKEIERLRGEGAQVRRDNYSVGMATGNIGQQFTESSNELGRALKDRMHLIVDTDYFTPQSIDTLDMLAEDRNPRVSFEDGEDRSKEMIDSHMRLTEREVPFEKYVVACYLVHGLDHLDDRYGGSKTALKSQWPNVLQGHQTGSDENLILPISPRAAKSIITFSQALDAKVEEEGVDPDYFGSMMTAFKFVSACSGVLNPAEVRANFNENPYNAMNAVIETTRLQFSGQEDKIMAGLEMANRGKKSQRVLSRFKGRWRFMSNILENLAERQNETA